MKMPRRPLTRLALLIAPMAVAASAVSVAHAAPPSVELVSPADRTMVPAGETTTLAAAVPGDPEAVVFFVDGKPVGGSTATPLEADVELAPGMHVVTARAVFPTGVVESNAVQVAQRGAAERANANREDTIERTNRLQTTWKIALKTAFAFLISLGAAAYLRRRTGKGRVR